MKNPERDLTNELVRLFARPWVLGAALVFIFIPSAKISQALESGAEFLKIGTDAKAMAMGSAYTAAASGADALHYNPAGLAGTKNYELAFSHADWLLDSRHDFIGLAFPVQLGGRQFGGGFGVTRLSNAGIEGRGADRSAGGSFNTYDQAVSLALAARGGRYGFGLERAYGTVLDILITLTNP